MGLELAANNCNAIATKKRCVHMAGRNLRVSLTLWQWRKNALTIKSRTASNRCAIAAKKARMA